MNEFLNDIRAFQTRADTKRKTSSVGDDSDDPDDELKTDQNSRSAAALHIKEHVQRFVKQLLHALMSLHELRIVHCDVKGDNIFISNENGHYIVKLGVRAATVFRPIFSFHIRISIFLIDSGWTHHQVIVLVLEAQ